ncbi:TIGR03619 family F420-dependent LLM class oxidoreductase [Nocardioides halotolerans]|uniref:TIGR03619 family F420-dependent LLM class oxidoreductase n=1 Tax=Nocardioides halotolerans TaxID=433660 RepID=UPI0003FE00C9|nr:TIGR03619 family F420-dependent LLM class oxidoreductase [Nocardioides halotolerans]
MTAGASGLVVGVQLAHYGAPLEEIGIDAMVDEIVASGLGGIWVSDHVVLVEDSASSYPYEPEGSYGFPAGTPWLEAFITLAAVAVRTEGLELGTSVCVLPQRDPVLLAKQCASLDQISGGRLRLGVGTGWLREEFAALGAPFAGRGARADAWLRLLRACWSGAPEAGEYGERTLPAGVRCEPRPVHGQVPVLVGGNSPAALARVARAGDGWLGAVPRAGLPLADLTRMVATIGRECESVGRDPDEVELSLRLAPRMSELGTDAFTELLASYVGAGVRRITIDLAWHSLEAGRERLGRLAASVAALGVSA